MCTDFNWLTKRSVKDAHPFPHQADCLAALRGNIVFDTMDLTSDFYNMLLQENDRKYSPFTTPLGLYDYNRLPQGLCNRPESVLRMMTNIFEDQNYLSLLLFGLSFGVCTWWKHSFPETANGVRYTVKK